MNEDGVVYRITPWGCLSLTLTDYNIDVSNVPGRIGEHIVEDFMDLMEKAGYVSKQEDQ